MTDKLRDAVQQDIRCECCGYMTHHREHLGCIRAALAQHSVYQLPDDLYPDSKCWVDGTYAERVEWLHTMYESSKQTLNVLLGQQDAQAVPQGYKLVPVEALSDHIADLRRCASMFRRRGMTATADETIKAADELEAMLNAAPTPPAQQDAQAVVQEPCAVVKWQTGGPVVHIIGDVQAGDLLYRAAPTPPAQSCWCQTCRPITINDMRMVLCPTCGNKRCPHANDHRNPCTGSNEPGQTGSAYPSTTPPAQRVMLTDEEIDAIYEQDEDNE